MKSITDKIVEGNLIKFLSKMNLMFVSGVHNKTSSIEVYFV